MPLGDGLSLARADQLCRLAQAPSDGVDSLGEDTLSRIIYGVRVSMLIGVSGTALA